MRDPDLDAWVEENYPSASMERVNAILSPDDQVAIMEAAVAAHKGDNEAAEQARARAGYGGLPGRR
jgi:hypothetical protein